MKFETSMLVEANRKAETIRNALNGFQARDVCRVFSFSIHDFWANMNCAEVITDYVTPTLPNERENRQEALASYTGEISPLPKSTPKCERQR
jgi:uncharacterized protein YqfB (UPF0267 family)